jgi:RimJ/RimL family protein N-acetyltransferase
MMETDRLILTPFSQADVPDLFAIRGDPQAMAFWDWPLDASLEDTKGAAEFMLSDVERQEAIYWTARLKSDNGFVGVFDLSELLSEAADLGFMIVRQLEGRGYAFEAAARVVAEARERGLRSLKARIHAGNTRSQSLLERLGFVAVTEADVEIRPGVTRLCSFFRLDFPKS